MSYPSIIRPFPGVFKTAFATDQIKATDILQITLSLGAPAEFSRNRANRSLVNSKGSLKQVTYQKESSTWECNSIKKINKHSSSDTWNLEQQRWFHMKGVMCVNWATETFFTIWRKSSEWHLTPHSTWVQRTKYLGLNASRNVQQRDFSVRLEIATLCCEKTWKTRT